MTNKIGKIVFIFGPMYSGKTFKLIKMAEKSKRNGKRIVCFKPMIDDRDGGSFKFDKISSRKEQRAIDALRVRDSMELSRLSLNSKHEVVFIDEIQFFDVKLKEVVCQLRDNGKTVICAGLDLYAINREPWETSEAIRSISNEFIALTAECRSLSENGKICGRPAIYTFKHGGDKNKKVDVGDSSKYTAYCKECWEREAEKQKNK